MIVSNVFGIIAIFGHDSLSKKQLPITVPTAGKKYNFKMVLTV